MEGKLNCKVVGSEPGFGLTERGKTLTSQVFLTQLIHAGIEIRREWGCGAAGSALEWHSRGQGFDPPQLH